MINEMQFFKSFRWSPTTAWVISVLLFGGACTTKQVPKPIVYDGPLREAKDIVTYYTENDKVKVLLKAKRILEYQTGDREFPEGIYLEFYNVSGGISSTLRANTAHYFKQENKWRGRGKVEVFNIEKHQQLHSEELFWMPATKKIFTDKFVTIEDQSDVIYGTGLDATQDLSSYRIKNINGTVEVKD